jgi:hypothetical protein
VSAVNNAVADDEDLTVNLTDGGDDELDLTGVDENAPDWPLVPEGYYEARLDSVEVGKSKKQKDMITWNFRFDHEGETIRQKHWTVLDPKDARAMKGLKRTLLALGPDLDLSAFKPRRDSNTLIGRSATLRIVQRPYNNNIVNNVQEILPSGTVNEDGDGGNAFLDELT